MFCSAFLPCSAPISSRLFSSGFRLGFKLALLVVSLNSSASLRAALSPYAIDPATLHLWHLDESTAPCVDMAGGGTNLTTLANGALLNHPSFPGFGTALNTLDGGQSATTTLNLKDALLSPRALANGTADDTALPLADSVSGAFTFEAIVRVDFDPTLNLSARISPLQIFSGDGDGSLDRIFQWRLDPVGVAAGVASDTSVPRLEFINLRQAVAVQNIVVAVPTNGVNAIVSNGWFHVAVVYDGNENAPENLRFYWTLLTTNATEANLIGTASLVDDLSVAACDFVIGNEGRSTGGSDGNWLGLIDEVRISSAARAATNFYWQPPPAVDSDNDGLADSWETTYFTNLSQGATNDFDLDTFNNLAEYTGGSNPTNLLSTPLDKDADGLPDSWEQMYFSSLNQTAAGDFDGDTYSNLQEHNAGTNPANAAFTPTDTDGDSLPDAWEQQYFNNSLAQAAGGDFDADGYSNLSEFQNGTNPASSASFPALPSVNYVPIEDGNTNTSEYGYAGSSSINTVNFVHNALHTENGQQFIAYYYRHATSTTDSNNNRIVIARRSSNTNVWQMFFTTFTANAITDGHDVAAFGIDGAGYLHLSWGMHGDAFHYAKTTTPVFGTNAIVFGPDTTMTGRENSVTYPQWLRMPNGDLLYFFREGASGNGDTFLNRYYVASQTWSNVHLGGSTQLPFLKGTGWNPNYNAYPNMPQLDADGNFHLVWTWRYQSDSPAGESGYQTNHDFDYARSTNGGATWLRQSGVPYALPISHSGESGNPDTTAEKILTIPEGYSLINQAGMCLDTNTWPVIATWWAPGTGLANTNTWWTPDMGTNSFRRQYMVSFRDADGVWQVRRISNRTNDPVGTKYNESFVRNLGRPVVVCDPVGRLIVLYRDNFGSNGLTIAHSLPYAVDPQRTNWTTFDLTTANLGNYEPVIDEARWELDQNLHIVHQPSQGEGYTPPANTAAPIGVVEWNAAAYFAHRPTLSLSIANPTNAALTFNAQPGWSYRVQTSTNLTSWQTLTTLPGIMGQMQYVPTNTVASDHRYWRLEIKEGGFAP